MKIARSKQELREMLPISRRRRVLVPTMGALHAGHIRLLESARSAAGNEGYVIASIFVNPIQFDCLADLQSYPLSLAADLAACQAAGVDLVFLPSSEEMYAPDRSVIIHESSLSRGLCGATRPGHFDGVCTVVLKLFLLTSCDLAVFGEKDFQQLAIVRSMVRDLDLPVEVLAQPTVREPDGLAMSSRNTRLTPEQRAAAPRIHSGLLLAATSGETSATKLMKILRSEIESSPLARIDYLALVHAESLAPLANISSSGPRCILAAAVFYNQVRLIDHLLIGSPLGSTSTGIALGGMTPRFASSSCK